MKTTQWLFERSDNKVKELEIVKRIYEKHGFDTDGIQWLLGKEKAARNRYRFLVQEEEKNPKKFYEDIACPMIELMAAWIEQVSECMKETGFDFHEVRNNHPETFDKNLFPNDDYLLYGCDWDKVDSIEEARELYDAGYRLIPTENEPNGQFLNWWGTDLVLKYKEM